MRDVCCQKWYEEFIWYLKPDFQTSYNNKQYSSQKKMSIQKSFSVAACLAAATTAQYVPLTVSVDGADAIKQYRSQNWSTATTSATY